MTTTNDHLRQFSQYNVSELTQLLDIIGTQAHSELIKTNHKILTVGGIALGADVAALAGNDGSSRYLLGSGFVNYKKQESIDNAEIFVKDGFNFAQRSNLEECSIIMGAHGYTSGTLAGKVLVFAGTKDQTFQELIDFKSAHVDATPLYRRSIQLNAALATIGITLKLIGVNLLEIDSTSNEINDSYVSPQLHKIQVENQGIWETIRYHLNQNSDDKKIILGESFTAGLLAQRITSYAGASKILEGSLIWYDSRLKQYVGVPKESLSDELIAKPSTIAHATTGLLAESEQSDLAIGTSGWANFWEQGEPDFFSIGCSQYLDKLYVETAKVIVTHTQHDPCSRDRRQITRYLGETTAWYLATRAFQRKYPQVQGFSQLAAGIEKLIKGYAILELNS